MIEKQRFSQLGTHLKQLRTSRQESLAEVSGAVEIDIEQLTRIERGSRRPSEDVLLLLISHFGIKEDEATKLWELAGYSTREVSSTHMINDETGNVQPVVMVMSMDARIVYTDRVHVMVNNYGVVMNFMQASGSKDKPLAVARVGMSKEHARSVLEVLQQTLGQDQKTLTPRSLPARRAKTDQADKQQ